MLIDPGSTPDAAGTGPLECSCGVLKLGPASGSQAATIAARCPACGDQLEIWPAGDDPC